MVTLPVLLAYTGSPVLANGTNRIGVLLQNLAAVAGFQTGGCVPWRTGWLLSVPTALGTIAGSWLAVSVSAGAMRVALALSFLVVAAGAMIPPPKTPRLRPPLREILFFLIGAYTGFLQAGVGFLLLACLVGGMGLDLVRANAVKVLVVFVAMVPSIAIYLLHGAVDLQAGLVLACGNTGGAWIAARLAIRRGSGFIRAVIAVAAVGVCVRTLFFP